MLPVEKSSPFPHRILLRWYGMKQKRHWLGRLAQAADLQAEVLPGQSLLELYGDSRILIEHHKGVTEYGQDTIRVRMGYGQVCICGKCLELSCMTSDQLIITGQIESVILCRR